MKHEAKRFGIFLGLWQPWTSVRSTTLGGTINKYTNTAQVALRDCMADCLQNKIYRNVGSCRSVVKSLTNTRCELGNQNSDDIGVLLKDSGTFQYFNRPAWYLGNLYELRK